ncbi:glycosyltransferase [Pseudomonas atacamensis]|jgi:rhamnosyltransferase|uniref:glycosyltransferase n=1 Tax=Pseudomonas atacamensis TaxID=2565368 RepID=UPI003208CCE5
MPVFRPKVAVLLAAYNGMQWIEQQLLSIQAQIEVDVVIHVSVDPSTDGTEAWCEAYAKKHSNFVLLSPAGVFGGASRNFFRLMRDVEFHDYDAIAFADQDDIWNPDKLQRASMAIQARDVDAYSSNVIAFWPDRSDLLLDKAQPQVAWDFLFEAAGPGCTYVMGKQLAQSLKGAILDNWQQLQEVSLHDWFCYAYARSHGYRWYIDPVSSMRYRQHESNQVGANTGITPLISRYKTIHNGWWFNQVQLITHLIGLDNDPFVRSWREFRRFQLIKLSFYAWRCRRRVRDKVLFFCICWMKAVVGNKER